MKRLCKSLLLMALSSSLFAVNPTQGMYGGILLGGNYVPSMSPFTFIDPNSLTLATGELKFSAMGNIGGYVGYRWAQLRVEIEGLYNYIPYHEIQTSYASYLGKKSSTTLRMQGNTSNATFFVNSFYDFYTAGSSTSWVPYVGVGAGYTNVWSDLKWQFNNQSIANTHVHNSSSVAAAQGILGTSYFLDDYTSFGLDYRYYTTGKLGFFGDNRLQVNTINLSFTGSFCL